MTLKTGQYLPILRIFIFTFLLTLVKSFAVAWGSKGHQVVALIAEEQLTPHAKQRVSEILGGKRLADVASWADQVRSEREETAPWHYVNWTLERDHPDYDVMTQVGGNVIWAIESMQSVLHDDEATTPQLYEALMYLTHFVGDLHQPLHTGIEFDRGANSIQVAWEGQPTNLHSVWDTKIINSLNLEAEALAQRSLLRVGSEMAEAAKAGRAYDWALESHRIVRDQCYGGLPHTLITQLKASNPEVYGALQGVQLPNGWIPLVETVNIRDGVWESRVVPELSGVYAEGVQPVIETRLAQAGIRLASILNTLFADRNLKQ